MDCQPNVNELTMTSAKLKKDCNFMKVLFEDGMPLKELEDQMTNITDYKDHSDSEIPERLYHDILQSSSILHFELHDDNVAKFGNPMHDDGIHSLF